MLYLILQLLHRAFLLQTVVMEFAVYSASGRKRQILLVYSGLGSLGDILTSRKANKIFLIFFNRDRFAVFICLSDDKALLRQRK